MHCRWSHGHISYLSSALNWQSPSKACKSCSNCGQGLPSMTTFPLSGSRLRVASLIPHFVMTCHLTYNLRLVNLLSNCGPFQFSLKVFFAKDFFLLSHLLYLTTFDITSFSLHSIFLFFDLFLVLLFYFSFLHFSANSHYKYCWRALPSLVELIHLSISSVCSNQTTNKL